MICLSRDVLRRLIHNFDYVEAREMKTERATKICNTVNNDEIFESLFTVVNNGKKISC